MLSHHPESRADATKEYPSDFTQLTARAGFDPLKVHLRWEAFSIVNVEFGKVLTQGYLGFKMLKVLNCFIKIIIVFETWYFFISYVLLYFTHINYFFVSFQVCLFILFLPTFFVSIWWFNLSWFIFDLGDFVEKGLGVVADVVGMVFVWIFYFDIRKIRVGYKGWMRSCKCTIFVNRHVPKTQ